MEVRLGADFGRYAVNATDRRTIGRILKVNHAGEYGAIRIYRAQLWVARRLYPDVVAFLEETLRHEIRHCSLFQDAMPKRSARPCRVMPLWGKSGLILGFLTSLLGRQGIWICTAAVESTVHRHLEDQLYFLRERDAELHSLILSIQHEELAHLHHAQHRIATQAMWSQALTAFISGCTDVVIWLSTWGDTSRMSEALAVSRSSAHLRASSSS
jgi:3-demethoxyubiquinol 3-hydroxylase